MDNEYPYQSARFLWTEYLHIALIGAPKCQSRGFMDICQKLEDVPLESNNMPIGHVHSRPNEQKLSTHNPSCSMGGIIA